MSNRLKRPATGSRWWRIASASSSWEPLFGCLSKRSLSVHLALKALLDLQYQYFVQGGFIATVDIVVRIELAWANRYNVMKLVVLYFYSKVVLNSEFLREMIRFLRCSLGRLVFVLSVVIVMSRLVSLGQAL